MDLPFLQNMAPLHSFTFCALLNLSYRATVNLSITSKGSLLFSNDEERVRHGLLESLGYFMKTTPGFPCFSLSFPKEIGYTITTSECREGRQ